MSKIVFFMPYISNLTDNHRLGQNGRRKYLKRDVRKWQNDLALFARNTMNLANVKFCAAPINVSVWYFLPLGVTADVGNFHKSLGDGLKVGLGIDDRYFLWQDREVKHLPAPEAGFVIHVEQVEKG